MMNRNSPQAVSKHAIGVVVFVVDIYLCFTRHSLGLSYDPLFSHCSVRDHNDREQIAIVRVCQGLLIGRNLSSVGFRDG